ncbi:OmpA family protein [Thermomonospora umbrina]|uniref:Type VI secretion system protein ImpK n=1 Tax=Thermomonospora umbrina TaxID=111806 RepID=A0A3D9SRL1_9ACTN|nr:OmpA family protein [Thermomonospora umbrina]REE97130.1 type VI secretion system protein ImpK [Thermomonospora umbrina]
MNEPSPLAAARAVTVEHARSLARSGHLAEAADLLEPLCAEADPGTAPHMLLACVYAQQGRWWDADRIWAAAQELGMGTPAVAAARRRVALLGEQGRRSAPWGRWLPAATAFLAVAALVLLVDVWRDDRTIREASAAPPVVSPRSSRTVSSLADVRPEVAGAQVERSAGELSVTFPRGLFSRGATLSSDGRATLGRLGGALRAHAGRLNVLVIGHTDPRPPGPDSGFATNAELGELRAAVVREALRSASGLSTSAFTLSTLADAASAAGDGRSARTVTLRISPAGAR